MVLRLGYTLQSTGGLLKKYFWPGLTTDQLSTDLGGEAQARVHFFFLMNLFIYFWLRWVFVAARGLSLVVASGGYSLLRCAGFSLRWLLLLQRTGSRAHGLSCSAARGIFPDQGSNLCLLNWQADS